MVKLNRNALKRQAINDIRTLITRHRENYSENHPEAPIEYIEELDDVCNHVANILSIELNKITPNKYEG